LTAGRRRNTESGPRGPCDHRSTPGKDSSSRASARGRGEGDDEDEEDEDEVEDEEDALLPL
jgi:hypothetical protein